MDIMWKKKQDPLCASAMNNLEEKLNSANKSLEDRVAVLEKLVEEQASTIATLQEDFRTRYHVLDNQITEAEGRVVSRIETLEDDTRSSSDYSKVEGKKPEDESSPGLERWSERKRKLAVAAYSPEVFTRPRTTTPATTADTKD